MVAPLVVAALTPFVKDLFSSGLTLLGNAVMSKGKDYVEKKLGVELPPEGKPIPPEKLVELRQLEFAHEETLQQLAVRRAELELEDFREEVKDKGSARLRDQALMALGRHNWRADLMFLLAVAMIAGLVWLIWKDPSINEYVKGIFTLVLGRFLGYLDNIYNFEFGTTRNNRTKDTTIEQLSRGGK